jgi:hypothetical protein
MIAIVALIWGVIVYKFFVKPKESDSDEMNFPMKPLTKNTDTSLYFEIAANYRDPFLKTVYKPIIKKDTIKVIKKELPKPEIKKTIYWPVIQYKGLIASKSAKLGVAIINNKQHLITKGDVVDKIAIINIYPDSIKLKQDNEIKTFYKK